MRIAVRLGIEMGHRLLNYKGACARLHGHSYHIDAVFEDHVNPDTDMVEDYKVLKEKLKGYFDAWDHRTVLHKDDPLGYVEVLSVQPIFQSEELRFLARNPTAERLCRVWFGELKQILPKLVALRVSETGTTWAEERE